MNSSLRYSTTVINADITGVAPPVLSWSGHENGCGQNVHLILHVLHFNCTNRSSREYKEYEE